MAPVFGAESPLQLPLSSHSMYFGILAALSHTFSLRAWEWVLKLNSLISFLKMIFHIKNSWICSYLQNSCDCIALHCIVALQQFFRINFQETLVLGSEPLSVSISFIVWLTGAETVVGVVDFKSSPVYFHVQRRSNYMRTGPTIPFDIERLNIGSGMSIASGMFKAPKSGIYFYSFTGLKDRPNCDLLSGPAGPGSLVGPIHSTLSWKTRQSVGRSNET